MSVKDEEEKKLLAHHEQLPLCTTRLPYRQGRKLTAVKVYTINNESNHLLIFGVPSLNLRQETKTLFIKFGKLLLFAVSPEHPAEDFTETYHARYERIQSARIAKRMVDTKNFYGGSLHVCYAPEFESVEETRTKLLQRKKDVLFRLRNLQKESTETSQMNNQTEKDDITNSLIQNNGKFDTAYEKQDTVSITDEMTSGTSKNESYSKKMNMGDNNIIYLNKHKRKMNNEPAKEKRFKPCFKSYENLQTDNRNIDNRNISNIINDNSIEVVDCTSIENEIVSNINDALNYNQFGNEVIRKVEMKPENKIIFHYNKKT